MAGRIGTISLRSRRIGKFLDDAYNTTDTKRPNAARQFRGRHAQYFIALLTTCKSQNIAKSKHSGARRCGLPNLFQRELLMPKSRFLRSGNATLQPALYT